MSFQYSLHDDVLNLRKELERLYNSRSGIKVKPARLVEGVLGGEARMLFIFSTMVIVAEGKVLQPGRMSELCAAVAAHRPCVQALASFVNGRQPRPSPEERTRAAAALGALTREEPCSPSGNNWDLVKPVLDACSQEQDIAAALEEFALGLGRRNSGMVLNDKKLRCSLVGAVKRGHSRAIRLLTNWVSQQGKQQQQEQQQEQQQQQAPASVLQYPGVLDAVFGVLGDSISYVELIGLQPSLNHLLSSCLAHDFSRAALLADGRFIKQVLPNFLGRMLNVDSSLMCALIRRTETRSTVLEHKALLQLVSRFPVCSDDQEAAKRQLGCLEILSALVGSGASRIEILQGVRCLLPALARSVNGGLVLAPFWRPIVEAVAADQRGRQLLINNAMIRAAVAAGVSEGSKSFLAVFELLLVDQQAAVQFIVGVDVPLVLQLLPTLQEHATQGKIAYVCALRAVVGSERLWQRVPAGSKQQLVDVVYSGYKQHFSEEQCVECVSELAAAGASLLGCQLVVEDVGAGVREGKAGWLRVLVRLLQQYDSPAPLAAAGLMEALRAGLVGPAGSGALAMRAVRTLLSTPAGRSYLDQHDGLLDAVCTRISRGASDAAALTDLLVNQGVAAREYLLNKNALVAAAVEGALNAGMARGWAGVVQQLSSIGGGAAVSRAVLGAKAVFEACLCNLASPTASDDVKGVIRAMLRSFDKEAASAKLQELLCTSTESPEVLQGAAAAYQALQGEGGLGVLLGAIAQQYRNLQEATVAFASAAAKQPEQGDAAAAPAAGYHAEGGCGEEPAAKRCCLR